MRALFCIFSVVCFMLVALTFGARSVFAATIYVNSSIGNDSTGDGSSDAPYKTFHQGYAEASSDDVLDLTGTFTWTDSDEVGDVSTNGYTISKPLILNGHGAGTTILQAASSDDVADRRVLTVDGSVSTTISGVTIRYGKQGSAGGGCVYAAPGSSVTIDRADIHHCRTTNGSANGAGLQNDSATLTVSNTSIHDNYVVLQGGGIDVYTGTLNVINTTIFNNYQSHGSGGGAGVIVRNGATARFLNSTITGNIGHWGGGISLYYSPTTYFENTIVAGNTGNSLGYNDMNGFFAGSINSLGFNIIGDYSSFPSTTGDWKDANRDGMYDQYLTGITGALNLDSTGRLNDSVNHTYTVALLPGSIAIDAATTTIDNGAFSVPTQDQRGASRSGVADIGAYEYSLLFPPRFTLTYTAGVNGSISGSSTQVVASGGDGAVVTAVPDSGYSFVEWSDGLLTAERTDTSVAEDVSVTATFVDDTPPVISSVTSTPSSTSAVLTWTTDELASSQVVYGPTTGYGSTSLLADVSPHVTSHSISIGSLVACATYHYRVTSADVAGNYATSSDGTFLTLGCVGSSPVSTSTATTIVPAGGGSISLVEESSALVLMVPSGFASSSANFQIKRLDVSAVETVAGRPSDYLAAGEHVYSLTAVTASSGAISVFDEALTVTMSYEAGDITTLEESTLRIFRWDDGAWTVLSDCSVNTSLRQVSCSTSHFSTFQLFGQGVRIAPSISSGGGGIGAAPVLVRGDLSGQLGIVLNEGTASTTDPRIRVRFLADLSTIRGYSLSLDPTFKHASLIDIHQSTTTFSLPDQPGVYTVYGKLFSKTGHASIPFQGTIEYRPSRSISLPASTSTVSASRVFVFGRTLRPGSKGEDVRELQRFLNRSNVLVAAKGAGSPGQETDYFGLSLASAVKRFQEANRGQILTPFGLKAGTGIFGDKTRQLIQGRMGLSADQGR
jgi:hypothetical protein